VHWVDGPGYYPFWAVTRHADIMEIERDNGRFLNAPRPLLVPDHADDLAAERGRPLRTLVHMDDPDHRAHRAVVADWFRPANVRQREADIRALARRSVDVMADGGGTCDFVTDVAVDFPLRVILAILGLPEEDLGRMLRLTQELFGSDDPNRRRSPDPEAQRRVFVDLLTYFTQLTVARRAAPTDDLASVIANARIDGEPLDNLDAASYYVIIATAGHDTTTAAIAGGLAALIAHPDQLDRLRDDPELIPMAVEEIIRWVTPVKGFMRTATEDGEISGTTIRAGQSVYLAYPSANRDEAAFDDPFRFDVGRGPNDHLAFGLGAHFCLGAHLARLEIRIFLEELLPRIDTIDLAGDPVSSPTTFVGGLTSLPIKYELRDDDR
jgi:cytochrome P450